MEVAHHDHFKGRAPWYGIKIRLTGLYRVHRKVVDEVVLAPGESLLDVGCGTGTVLALLAKRFGSGAGLFGIDPSEDMLQEARKHTPSTVKYKRAFGNDLPFVSATFATVISTLAFHHILPEEKGSTLREMHRVLRPGGLCIIADFGRPESLLGRFLSWFSRGHAFTEGTMELLEDAAKGLFTVEKRDVIFGYIECWVLRKL